MGGNREFSLSSIEAVAEKVNDETGLTGKAKGFAPVREKPNW